MLTCKQDRTAVFDRPSIIYQRSTQGCRDIRPLQRILKRVKSGCMLHIGWCMLHISEWDSNCNARKVWGEGVSDVFYNLTKHFS